MFGLGEKRKYYSLDKILSKNCTYNVVIGERSNGKTYACLAYILNTFLKTGKQAVIIRRWQIDIVGTRASQMFANFSGDWLVKASKGRFDSIKYYSGKFYLGKYDEKVDKIVYSDRNLFCFLMSLSDNEHNKSLSYPDVGVIVFDEFIAKNVYLPDEFVLFMNTLSTIIRDRTDIKIFMLGNTINKNCPYFEEMGLRNVLSQQQGTIDLYSYSDGKLKVAVEYTAPNASGKTNNYIFGFENPKLETIKNGAWELSIYPHRPVKFDRKDILYIFLIKWKKAVYQCEIVCKDEQMFIFCHVKTTPIKDDINTLIYDIIPTGKINYSSNIFQPRTHLEQVIKGLIVNEKIFFQNNVVGDYITSFLKYCKGLR